MRKQLGLLPVISRLLSPLPGWLAWRCNDVWGFWTVYCAESPSCLTGPESFWNRVLGNYKQGRFYMDTGAAADPVLTPDGV